MYDVEDDAYAYHEQSTHHECCMYAHCSSFRLLPKPPSSVFVFLSWHGLQSDW